MDMTHQKPFACKSPGCGMSFTNEDHLNVHEKKHEMVLNLGLKSANVFVADQTPTPTRLIKNCEEVGLFDDLKHVNPFDETFRRAVEAKNIPTLTMDSPTNPETTLLKDQDSLHTPHVFPNINDALLQPAGNYDLETPNVILNNQIPVKTVKPKTKRKVQKRTERHILPNKATVIMPKLLQPKLIAVSFPTNVPVAKSPPSKPLILPKIVKNPNTVVPHINLKSTPTSQLPIKERLKAALHLKARTPELKEDTTNLATKRKSHTEIDPNDNCMERRRAASCRYRNKIKREHCDLKKKNANLTAENEHLKTVIRELRSTLSKHHNCEVSKSLNAGQALPEIQIPSSTVHLVMKIPNMIINPAGGSSLVGNSVIRMGD